MKSDRRHQLETNLLADRVGNAIETAKPYIGWATLGLGVMAVLSVIYLWMQGQSLEKAAVAWTEYYFADGDAKKLVPVYQDYSKTTAALWARQAEADHFFANGIDSLYIDRKRADELLKQAQAGYETIIQEARDPFLLERATFGLAQVHESQGNPEEAIRQYTEIVRMGSVQPTLVNEVERRLAALKGETGQKFYAWFKDFRPLPSTPLGLPGNLNSLPGLPDFNFPPSNPVGTEFSIPGGLNLDGLQIPPATSTDGSRLPNVAEPAGVPALAVPPGTSTDGVPAGVPAVAVPPGELSIPTSDPPVRQP